MISQTSKHVWFSRFSAATASFLVACGPSPVDTTEPYGVGVAGDGRLEEALESVRAQYDLPALGALLIRGDEIVESAVVGVRIVDTADEATVQDEWAIASITKTMTATLAGILVERGDIDWSTTVGNVFPDLVTDIRSEYVDVRLDELLSHRSGLPSDFVTPFFNTLYGSADTPRDQRREWIVELLNLEPVTVPANDYSYSNPGYVVAGAMMEAAADESWEGLMQTEIFDPLGMTTAGFGRPAAATGVGPWGHREHEDGTLLLLNPTDPYRLALGPLGSVVATFADMAPFAMEHLAGARGEDGLVTAATFDRLHTSEPFTGYALGWHVGEGESVPGPVIWHSGVLIGFTSLLFFVPEIDMAVFVVTNVDEIVGQGVSGVTVAGGLLLDRFQARY